MSFSAFVSVGEGSHAGTHLEEIGEGALVAEAQGVGYFANRHVGMGEEVAGFLVDERGDVLVDGRAAYLLDQAREVGCGDIHLAGVETDLALLTEVAVQVMEEDFVHLLLVLEVVGDGPFTVMKARSFRICTHLRICIQASCGLKDFHNKKPPQMYIAIHLRR